MAIALTSTDKGISTESTYFTHDKRVVKQINVDEARKILDFDVITEPLCRPNGEVTYKGDKGDFVYNANGEYVPDVFNLVRTDTNTILPIGKTVGKEFKPVSHLGVFDFLTNEVMPNMPELQLETVATMYGGASSLVTANFGDKFALPNDTSEHRTRIIWSNPMGRGSLLIGFTNVRVVCQNTLQMARKQVLHSSDGFKIQHTVNAQYRIDEALSSIHEQIEDAKTLRSMQEVLAKMNINSEQVTSILDKIYPLNKEKGTTGYTRTDNMRNEVMRQFESGETAQTMTQKTPWSLFNSFTYGMFNPTKMNIRNDQADIAYTGMIGTRADKVSKIFNTFWSEFSVAA